DNQPDHDLHRQRRTIPGPAPWLNCARGHRPRITTTGEFEQRAFPSSTHAAVAMRASRAVLSGLDLIDHALFDAAVSIDPAISQKWPMRPLLVDASPIDVCGDDFFAIHRTFGDDFAVRSAHKALAPKFNAISTGGRFVTNAVRHRHVTPVCDGMTTL